MASVTLILPDDLAASATRAGLFQPQASEAMVREALRMQAATALQAILDRGRNDEELPMSEAEIQAEIDAYRAERREWATAR